MKTRRNTRRRADGLIAALDRAGLADKARIDAEIEEIERRLATLKLASRLLETKNGQAARPRFRKPRASKPRPVARRAINRKRPSKRRAVARRPLKKLGKSGGENRLEAARARREKIAGWLNRHGPAGPAQIAEGVGFTFIEVYRSLSQGNGTLFKQLAPHGHWAAIAKSPNPSIPKSLSAGEAAQRLKPAKGGRVVEHRRMVIEGWLADHAPASVPAIADGLGMATGHVRQSLNDKRFRQRPDHQWENAGGKGEG